MCIWREFRHGESYAAIVRKCSEFQSYVFHV